MTISNIRIDHRLSCSFVCAHVYLITNSIFLQTKRHLKLLRFLSVCFSCSFCFVAGVLVMWFAHTSSLLPNNERGLVNGLASTHDTASGGLPCVSFR